MNLSGMITAPNAFILVVAGFNVFSIGNAYDVRRFDDQHILAVSSHSDQRVEAVLYEPARKLVLESSPEPHLSNSNSYRKSTAVMDGITSPYGPAMVQPTVIKKTLRNENGILRYRPVGYTARKNRKNSKRKHWRRGRPKATKASKRTTARGRTRRKNRYKSRRARKLRPTRKSNLTPTPTGRFRDETIKARKLHRTFYTPSPRRTSSKRIESTGKPVRNTTLRPYQHPGFQSNSQQPGFDIRPESSRRKVDPYRTNRHQNTIKNNQYGLAVPTGFRLTTASISSDSQFDVVIQAKSPKPQTASISGTTPLSKKYRPTNPSLSILQIPTSSIDDAYMILKDTGTGFRVKLLPTAVIKGKDLTTDEIDEFDLLSDRNASDSRSSDKRDTAISALRALFRKLSNATDFRPRRREAGKRRDYIRTRPTVSNGSWWEREHVCVTETPGLYGLPSSIFDRLTITTKCLEKEDAYECTDSFGTGNNKPTKTTSYRCCQGFQKSANSNQCQPVEFLLDDDANVRGVAGFSADTDFSPDAAYDHTQAHTVFMPSDEVVSEFLAGNQLDGKDKNDVEMFLENHVIVGKNLHSASLNNDQLLTALSGNTIRINFFEDRKQMTANCRRVLKRDVANGNSVVHFIDDIIREVKGSLYDYISKHFHQYSMFKFVVDTSGLAPLLQAVNTTTSLFLPTNEAFEMARGLPDSQNCLASIVRNHLLNGIICSASWNNSNTTLKTQEGEDLVMEMKDNRNLVNGAIIVEEDIMTMNGVVHVVDGLLQPLKVQSVLTLMNEDPENAEMLRYLKFGGMNDVLTSGDNFTLLVPKKDAFKTLPSGVTNRLKKNPDALQRFLLRHTIPFELTDTQLPFAKYLSTLNPSHRLTVTSYDIRVTSGRGDKVIHARRRVTAIQCARVSSIKPKRACNGAIVQIEQALVPPSGSVFSILRQAPRGNFSILLRAIAKAKVGQSLAKSEEITFFAPTNDAFERLPSRFVKFLFQNVRSLEKLVRYHITKGFHCCDHMAQGYARLPTLLGPTMTSCPKKGHILLGRNQKRLRAKVVKCDVMAINGMIHAIDNVLIPSGFRD